ncbi:AMP-binding protein [Streptomyces sp. SID8379]|uniref:class I adenylate-forming enzyme family protein n=1 Tax=unclassified Streptomyces TaxID=2593676 RepID=UPI0003627AD7|nr:MULTISPECIES: AMP-binding protein [unclassified Streptomyces]MYW68794.1 AMP-binding protein [Streptomyces sp. SID8379]
MHLSALLDNAVQSAGDREAVVYRDRRWTYPEFADAARRAATVLRRAGLGPGDRLAVMTYNTPAFLFAAFGAWYAGATLVPVNHKLQTAEVAHQLRHCGAKVGIVDAEIGERATAADTDGLRWLTSHPDDPGVPGSFEDLIARAEPWTGEPGAAADTADADDTDAADAAGDTDAADDGDIAQILYTSGTSGRPKGCVHTHRGIALTATYTATAVPLRRDDRFLICMPIWHASPLNNWALGTLFLGGTVVLQREYEPRGMLELVQRERITALFGAPIALIAPVQSVPDFADFDLTSVRAWIYGAGPLDADTARRLMKAYGSDDFHQVYGMSETGPVGATLSPAEQVEKAGSIGRGGMPGVALRVVRPDGADAGAGETGEIWLRSDTRMVGYLDDPAATAEVFAGDWYRSGDLGRIDADGFVTLVDRMKDVIVTGGENVASQEVEGALRGHPDILDVAVVGRPHPQWGETVVAVVVPRPDAGLDLDGVREWLEPRIARYKIPRELVLRDELPRTPSGKVTKHVLRAALAEAPA